MNNDGTHKKMIYILTQKEFFHIVMLKMQFAS